MIGKFDKWMPRFFEALTPAREPSIIQRLAGPRALDTATTSPEENVRREKRRNKGGAPQAIGNKNRF